MRYSGLLMTMLDKGYQEDIIDGNLGILKKQFTKILLLKYNIYLGKIF
jgi:hypothetical protein